MFAVLVALVASFCTALSSVLATRGMKDSNPDTANLVMTGIQTLILTVFLFADIPKLNTAALLWYALAGICGSFIGRLLTLTSYKRIGVAPASALIGTSPVVTTLLAILFLGEPILLAVILGAVLVVTGIALVNMKKGTFFLDWNTIYLPLAASGLYAVSNILRKMGTNILPHSVLGAHVSTLSGLVAFGLYLGLQGGFSKLELNKDNFSWLAGSGLVNAIAWVAITMAINLGKVSVTTSIVYSYPLFSVLLSRLMLKDEPFNNYMVLGSLLIVLGVVIVSFFS